MSHYVVLDLEMCKVPKAARREVFHTCQEIIQIGAVELDDSFRVARSFMTYVKPEYGAIDSVIHRLTGISSQDTDSAPRAEEAFASFAQWLPEDARLVTWSESDVNQIDDELYFKGIDVPQLYDCMEDYIDCQELFSERMNRDRRYSLKEALLIAGVDYDTNIHDALTDARNTARLFSKVQTEEQLILSPYYMTNEDFALYRRQYAYC